MRDCFCFFLLYGCILGTLQPLLGYSLLYELAFCEFLCTFQSSEVHRYIGGEEGKGGEGYFDGLYITRSVTRGFNPVPPVRLPWSSVILSFYLFSFKFLKSLCKYLPAKLFFLDEWAGIRT